MVVFAASQETPVYPKILVTGFKRNSLTNELVGQIGIARMAFEITVLALWHVTA